MKSIEQEEGEMGLVLGFVWAFFLMSMSILTSVTYAKNEYSYKVFNVKQYGAVSDGKTETSEAFLKAWNDACQWNGKSMVLIPQGQYMVDSMLFLGPCKVSIAFHLRGTLKSPINPKNNQQWITFRYVNGLSVSGGGFLDGEGPKVWGCRTTSNCNLPASMRLEFVTNGRVHHIRSINSRNAHFFLYGCRNINMTNLRLSAPANSPNTDGIKIGMSKKIRISTTSIGTGDDCIAIINGSRSIGISDVFCGPGHGISVGSMGYFPDKDTVMGVSVRNSIFSGTTDGLRIKTWSTPNAGFASNFFYENIEMRNVGTPIIIDQHYCPYPPCDQKSSSHIQISNITYSNIWGNSGSKVAVNLNCSKTFPCKNIVLKNINLLHRGGTSSSFCSYAMGDSYGHQKPPSCL